MLGNRYLALVALGAIWGVTFALISVAIRGFEPEGILALRMLLGALTAAPFAFAIAGPHRCSRRSGATGGRCS